MLNKRHRNLRLTMEIGDGGDLSFLDLKIIRGVKRILFDLYRNILRMILESSNYPWLHKIIPRLFPVPRQEAWALTSLANNIEVKRGIGSMIRPLGYSMKGRGFTWGIGLVS